jgi:beta-phosphoglucomutase-like phosphatase (HAD superfamily)
MKSTCKAVIFDMDGLLIDTESHSKAAWQGAAQQIGESLDDETMYVWT